MPAPEGFIIPTTGLDTGIPGVLKAVTGASGTQGIKFFIHQQFNDCKSKAAKQEIFDSLEMVEFKNDPYSSYACMTKDMTEEQRLKTARLYERFLTQKDSDDTPIENWDRLSSTEKARLMMAGINTVEQICSFSEAEKWRLGIGAKDLQEKARMHIDGKESRKVQESNQEMMLIAEENRKLRERLERLEQLEFERQAERADDSKPRGRPARIQVAVPEAISDKPAEDVF